MSLLLTSYILSEIVFPALATFFILNAILLLGQLVPLLDVILHFGIGLADFIRLVAYLCPQLFLFSIPMAALIGVILGISRLTNEGEIMALKACGVSCARLLPALGIAALVTAGITAYTSIQLLPASQTLAKRLLFQLARDKFDRGLQPGVFSEGTGNFVIYVDAIDPESKQWHGVFISDISDKQHPVTILAQNGTFTARPGALALELHLTRGSLHRASDTTTQTLSFDSYQLTIPIPPPRLVAGKSLATTNRHEMSMAALRQGAATQPPAQKRLLLFEWHKRLIIPGAAFLFTLLGLPLGLLARPGHRALGLPLGIVFFLGYYVLYAVADNLIDTIGAPVGPTLWSVDLIYGILVLWLLLAATRDKLDSYIDALDAMTFSLRLRFRTPFSRS